jgi:hypothetical protein
MSNIKSYVETCTDLIQSGSTRDDIDQYLKDKGVDAKAAAAIHLELQYIFVEQERISQRKEDAWSNIVAGAFAMIINALFTIYTIVTGGYISLLLSIVMFYFGWKYISQGRNILKNLEDKTSIFDNGKSKYAPKR